MESSGLVTFPIPADIQALLGPPPVLTDEAAAVYRLGLAKFALLIKPSDVLGWLYVNSLTYDWCEIRLLRSLKPCAIRGRFEAEAKRNNEAEAHEMRRHADIQPWNPMGGDANLFGQWMGDYERVDELLRRAEQRFEDTIRQID